MPMRRRTWTTPEHVPPLGRVPLDDGTEEGVSDVVPEWHPRSSSVLALGHHVFYRKHPDRVAIMGNFHVTNAAPDESWVTDGEWLHRAGGGGDLLLARIHWARPNSLATDMVRRHDLAPDAGDP